MPSKCVMVEVVLGGIPLGVSPDKVAQQVKWALEGATVPNFHVQKVQGDESAEVSHYPTAEEVLAELKTRWGLVELLPQRPSSATS